MIEAKVTKLMEEKNMKKDPKYSFNLYVRNTIPNLCTLKLI